MRYKAGDKVRVRDWDDMVKEFGICGGNITIPGCYFVDYMKKYCNCIVTISELTIHDKYLVEEDSGGGFVGAMKCLSHMINLIMRLTK